MPPPGPESPTTHVPPVAQELLNIKFSEPEVAAKYPALAALFAVTAQVVADEVVNDVPLMEQFAVFVVKLTAPSPEPPEDVNTMAVPTIPVRVVFEIERLDWAIDVEAPVMNAEPWA